MRTVLSQYPLGPSDWGPSDLCLLSSQQIYTTVLKSWPSQIPQYLRRYIPNTCMICTVLEKVQRRDWDHAESHSFLITDHYFWPKERKQALKMDRACDGGGCHSEKSDWQEEKEKKKPPQNQTTPNQWIIFSLMVWLQEDKRFEVKLSSGE